MSDKVSLARRRWLYGLLTISLAVNFFLAGLMIGGRNTPGPRFGGGPEFNLRQFARTLPPEARQALRESIRTQRGTLRPVFERLSEQQMRLYELMGAETFDAEAVREALSEVRSTRSQLQQPIHETVVEVAKTLTPDERLELIERLARNTRPRFGE